ncbi:MULTISPECIES: nuclear transport factor 2 family protein [unclassified Rhizobacter]|uniref:nuclear transport factor 2 family protein n=1 Tax=unclassified Rhizobacter TaxID=2640088 RepID=UPI000AA910ED|nr:MULTISPECIES: nuclear transport factor 2 family protein [unclassified Rhizobacter]
MSVLMQRRKVTAISLLLLAGAGSPAVSLAAQSIPAGPPAKSDPRAKTYETYLSAWGPVDDGRRLALLRDSLSEDVVFTNPIQTRRGIAEVIAHLEAFQKRSPGGLFRMNEMLGWENHGLATWQFVDAKGEAGFWGYDVVEFDPGGRMRTILLFGHSEKTILK